MVSQLTCHDMVSKGFNMIDFSECSVTVHIPSTCPQTQPGTFVYTVDCMRSTSSWFALSCVAINILCSRALSWVGGGDNLMELRPKEGPPYPGS